MKIFKTNNFFKIGLIFSLILHIGIFALGGYIMHNLTKPLESAKQAQNDEITYVDVQTPEQNNSSEVAVPANPESEVTISEEKAPEVQTEKEQPKQAVKPQPQAEEKAPANTENTQANPPAPPKADAQDDKNKLPTYADIKVPMKKIEPSRLELDENDLQNSTDSQPTVVYKANPEYDPSWIPKGEEIVVIIAFTLDNQGNVTDVYIQSPAQTSAKMLGYSLSPEIEEAINVRAAEAVIKSKIQPPKNPKANGPYQIPMSFKNP